MYPRRCPITPRAANIFPAFPRLCHHKCHGRPAATRLLSFARHGRTAEHKHTASIQDNAACSCAWPHQLTSSGKNEMSVRFLQGLPLHRLWPVHFYQQEIGRVVHALKHIEAQIAILLHLILQTPNPGRHTTPCCDDAGPLADSIALARVAFLNAFQRKGSSCYPLACETTMNQ